VTFTNLSDGTYDACLWDFGDGETSTDCVGPTHTYAASGTYTVSLTVTDTGTGESDTITRTDYVTVSEPAYVPVDADFEGAPISGVVPLTVQFTNLSTGDYVTTAWDFGDTGTSSAENPTHTYVAAGSYTVTLTATGPGGTDVEEKVGYIDVRYGVYLPLVLNNH
jgi:PKD repeat protein